MRCDQDGFVLVATLGILVIMFVTAGFFHAWVEVALVEAHERQRQVKQAIDEQGTLAIIKYTLATQYLDTAGLRLPQLYSQSHFIAPKSFDDPFNDEDIHAGSYLPLDDRPIKGLGNVIFSCQDASGLIGLNSDHTVLIESLLEKSGVPIAEQQVMLDRLLDYRDKDQLHRLNGAEVDEYLKAQLAPPADSDLLSSWELQSVLGWKQQHVLWQQGYLPRVTNCFWHGIPNINTAPLSVLMATLDISEQEANKIITWRFEHPITSLSELHRIVGKPTQLDELALSFFPSPYFRLSLWGNNVVRMKEIYLKLSSSDARESSPWVIEYSIEVPILRDSVSTKTLLEVPFFNQ